MTARVHFPTAVPEVYAAIRALDALVQQSGLDKTLIELVKTRASQINACAFCLDMHTKDALAHGETGQRLHVLPAWRETPYFTARERAALAWTEHLTRLHADGAPDAAYDGLKAHFTDTEIAALTALIGVINLWNRVAVGLAWQMPPPAPPPPPPPPPLGTPARTPARTSRAAPVTA